MKKTIVAILVSIIVFSLFPVISLAAPFSQGDGSESNPYGISTPEELNAVRDYPNAHFIMLNDIDMTAATSEGGVFWNDGAGWEPIEILNGTFDGNGYSILRLRIYRPIYSGPSGYVGLFGVIGSTACVKNLGMKESSIISSDYVGGIAGRNLGEILNCYNSGMIHASDRAIVGGIVGKNKGLVSYSYNNGNITSDINSMGCGGIVGEGEGGGSICGCYNSGNINSIGASRGAGGIQYSGASSISDCYNSGAIYGRIEVGGIIGYSFNNSISNCYNVGNVAGIVCGIIVGQGTGEILTNCYYLNTKDEVVGDGNAVGVNIEVKTNEEMQVQSQFDGFDFTNIWTMSGDEDYPYPELRAIYHTSRPNDGDDFDGGNGLPYDPYQITTPEQLNSIRNHLGAYFVLNNDIDLTLLTSEDGQYFNGGAGWVPIGQEHSPFYGNLDGMGHAVSGVHINRTDQDYIGLFGYITDDAAVQNLSIKDCMITGYDYTGAIAGYTEGVQTNCDISGKVKGNSYVGGICGKKAKEGVLSSCNNSGDVTGVFCVGGIVGDINGEINFSGNIIKCSNGGNVSGTTAVGGIAGNMRSCTNSSGDILLCYNTGLINASGISGGILGSMYGGHINECYNTGRIQGNTNSYYGGICGDSSGLINDCFNMGIVDGVGHCGGIVGFTNSRITNCYSVGKRARPIAGWAYFTSIISNCYYLDETAEDGDSEANTHEELLHQNTYMGFDFGNKWNILEGQRYPILRKLPFEYLTNFELKQSSIDLYQGDSIGIELNISPNNASSKAIRWEESNSGVTLNNDGLVTALYSGTTVITATTIDGHYSDTCTIHAYSHATDIELNKSFLILQLGSGEKLEAVVLPRYETKQDVVWSSDNENIASVDINGNITSISEGKTTIRAITVDGGFFATCEVTIVRPVNSVKIDKPELNLYIDDTGLLSAIVSPSDAKNKQVTWSSNNPVVATVDQNGRVTAVKAGSATITATVDGKSDTCIVTVIKPVTNISLSSSSETLNIGVVKALTATVSPSDATNKQVSWSSSNSSVATVDQNGKVTAVKAGSATITATADGVSDTCQITVSAASVSYQSHVQNIGWQGWKTDGESSGTSGQSLRLEAIRIKLDGIDGGIEYRTHVQNIGWMDWVPNGALSGTSGQSLRLEAIGIQLTGEVAYKYDVYYRVHAQNIGWMGWAKNGDSSGTAGFGYRLEAIQIKLVAKGGAAPGSTDDSFVDAAKPTADSSVIYQSHVQNIGWQDWKRNGDSSGTSGQSLRLEAMCMKLENVEGGIEYRTHVQNIGWMDWVSNGALSGTSGQSLRLESIMIWLTGAAADKYDVYYRVHAQNFGWMGWAKNGESSGTAGFSYRLEAIQIVLVTKGGAAPGSTANAFVQNGI